MNGARRMENGDEAVSPVIATILLLAITVLLTSAVYLMISSGVQAPNKGVPAAQASVRMLDNGYQVVTITEMNAQVETFKCKFQLIPPDEANSTTISGYTSDSDVYGVSGQNVSFQDRDAGFTVNTGDYFVIDAASVGSDSGDWIFRMLFEGSGGRSSGEIFAVTLPS
ncbi:MAG: type IV pilin N-terminal domain-containing protein [Euryarchaeota archaeon]|jgi:flagellin-like protein|nr:type IV pilin N-terminal domain-containing protein [Euryarchaeota archaeon]